MDDTPVELSLNLGDGHSYSFGNSKKKVHGDRVSYCQLFLWSLHYVLIFNHYINIKISSGFFVEIFMSEKKAKNFTNIVVTDRI